MSMSGSDPSRPGESSGPLPPPPTQSSRPQVSIPIQQAPTPSGNIGQTPILQPSQPLPQPPIQHPAVSLGYSRATTSCEPSEFSTPTGDDDSLQLLPEVAATGRPVGSRRPFQRRRRSRACDACRARKTKVKDNHSLRKLRLMGPVRYTGFRAMLGMRSSELGLQVQRKRRRSEKSWASSVRPSPPLRVYGM